MTKIPKRTRKQSETAGKAYERFAARALASCFSLPPSAIKQNIVLRGASGAGHEIDILFRFPSAKSHPPAAPPKSQPHSNPVAAPSSPGAGAPSKRFAAVECKNYKKPLEMKTVSAFHGVLQDIRAALPEDEQLLGIVASASGFQSGAVEMAGHFGLLLLEIRKPDKQAWRKYIDRFWPGLRPSVGNLDAFLFLNQRVHVVRGSPLVPGRPGKEPPEALVMQVGDPPDQTA